MVLECFEECSEKDDWVEKGVAFRVCKAWLCEHDHRPLSTILQTNEMGEHLAAGFDYFRQLPPNKRSVQRTDTKRYWIGLRLTAEGQRLLDETAAP